MHRLGLEQKTVPLLLQKAGYRTGIIGKYLNQVRVKPLVCSCRW